MLTGPFRLKWVLSSVSSRQMETRGHWSNMKKKTHQSLHQFMLQSDKRSGDDMGRGVSATARSLRTKRMSLRNRRVSTAGTSG